MGEPYLILHKVRGEPAFDIAERLEQSSENSGTDWWIIPTSGHRAYPSWSCKLHDLYSEPNAGSLSIWEQIGSHVTGQDLSDLPDHYAINDAPKPKTSSPRVMSTTDDFLV